MSFSWSSRCPQSPGGPHLTPWASASSRVRNREGQGRAGGAPGAPARPRAPSAPGSPGRWRGRAQPVPAAGGWGTPARGLGDSKMSLGAAGVLAWRGPHRALARLRSGESRAVPAQQPPAPAPPAVSPAGAAEGRIPRGTSREARARQRRLGCSDGTNRGAVRPAGPAHGAWPEGRGLHPAPRAGGAKGSVPRAGEQGTAELRQGLRACAAHAGAGVITDVCGSFQPAEDLFGLRFNAVKSVVLFYFSGKEA